MWLATSPDGYEPTSLGKAILGLIGFTSVLSQIVLMRELIVVFNGNEISLGVMLATWLLWTAVGSSVASRFGFGRKDARQTVALLEILLGISLPSTIWILRVSGTLIHKIPGELAGPLPMLLTSLACFSVLCFLSGCLFVVAASLYQQECGVVGRVATSTAYLYEAVGAGLGGILASVVLLRFLEPFQIATFVAIVNLCMAVILLAPITLRQLSIAFLAAAILALPLVGFVAPILERSGRRHLWNGFRVIESHDSIYGNLAVTETGSIRSIYENGEILASAPDQNAAEEAVHYALLEHPAPQKVLLVGGGENGSIVEALKHRMLERLDYVELDPALIRVFQEFFKAQAVPSLSDPRVHLHYADARHYLKTVRDRYDVIILNVPEPLTSQLNRFYTAELFHSARDHLNPTGLLALQLRSSEDYISPNRAEFLRCIKRTLREIFPYVATIPGDPIHFFAALQPDFLTEDPQILISRLRSRDLQTQYVREYFIPFRMMPDRMAQIHRLLQPLPSTPVNRDFEPVAYYFDVVLWSAQFKTNYTRLFQAVARIRFSAILDGTLALLLLTAVVFAYVPTRERCVRASAAFCTAATGFTLMELQVFLLLAFQSIYGYVYHQLAVLIGAFMAGIALGSWQGIKRIRVGDHTPFISVAATTQFVLALSAPATLYLLTLLSRNSGVSGTPLVTQLVFPVLAAGCGALGGYQFPVTTQLYLRDSPGERGLGILYAVDLLGGCAGALLLSGYLIPLFGFWKTAWLSAAVNLAPTILAAKVSLSEKVSPA